MEQIDSKLIPELTNLQWSAGRFDVVTGRTRI